MRQILAASPDDVAAPFVVIGEVGFFALPCDPVGPGDQTPKCTGFVAALTIMGASGLAGQHENTFLDEFINPREWDLYLIVRVLF